MAITARTITITTCRPGPLVPNHTESNDGNTTTALRANASERLCKERGEHDASARAVRQHHTTVRRVSESADAHFTLATREENLVVILGTSLYIRRASASACHSNVRSPSLGPGSLETGLGALQCGGI